MQVLTSSSSSVSCVSWRMDLWLALIQVMPSALEVENSLAFCRCFSCSCLRMLVSVSSEMVSFCALMVGLRLAPPCPPEASDSSDDADDRLADAEPRALSLALELPRALLGGPDDASLGPFRADLGPRAEVGGLLAELGAEPLAELRAELRAELAAELLKEEPPSLSSLVGEFGLERLSPLALLTMR